LTGPLVQQRSLIKTNQPCGRTCGSQGHDGQLSHWPSGRRSTHQDGRRPVRSVGGQSQPAAGAGSVSGNDLSASSTTAWYHLCKASRASVMWSCSALSIDTPATSKPLTADVPSARRGKVARPAATATTAMIRGIPVVAWTFRHEWLRNRFRSAILRNLDHMATKRRSRGKHNSPDERWSH